MTKPKFDPVMLSVEELYEFPGNPNEESPEIFNNLVEEIAADGWDEPVVVVPRDLVEPGKLGYTVVSGNHRLKAAKVLEFQEIPCIVKDHWDEETAKIKVIRRNNIRGENNASKFTKLVDSFDNKYTIEELAERMGFTDIVDFEKLYLKSQKDYEEDLKDRIDDTKNEINLVDGLSLILNKLFAEFGNDIPHSFMFFLAGGKIHLAVLLNTKLKKLLEQITVKCVQNSLDINVALAGLLGLGVAATNLENGPPELEAIENMANEGANEDYDLHFATKNLHHKE